MCSSCSCLLSGLVSCWPGPTSFSLPHPHTCSSFQANTPPAVSFKRPVRSAASRHVIVNLHVVTSGSFSHVLWVSGVHVYGRLSGDLVHVFLFLWSLSSCVSSPPTLGSQPLEPLEPLEPTHTQNCVCLVGPLSVQLNITVLNSLGKSPELP